MSKLIALLIYDRKNLIHTNYDLSGISFWYHHVIKNKIEHISRKSLSMMSKNKLYKMDETINDIQLIIYGCNHDKTIIVITTPTYPQYLVRNLILNISMNKNADELWAEYCDGTSVDKIQLIKTELDNTKTIMIDSIEKILERGESMDDLLAKTNDLQIASTIFADTAKDMNSCCIIF